MQEQAPRRTNRLRTHIKDSLADALLNSLCMDVYKHPAESVLTS